MGTTTGRTRRMMGLATAGALIIMCGCVVTGCSETTMLSRSAADQGASEPTVDMLASWMEGSFSSQAQSLADPAYFDIRLHMKRIWPQRTDGPWLYVEQARADLPDKPYRQRVYRVSRLGEGVYRSDVYTLPEPVARYTGAWRGEPIALAAITGIGPDDLKMLDGCGVVLRWDGTARTFTGGTEGTGCASTREEASYTSSQITLREGVLNSWDRGFDSAGKQVWGAVKGGYEFVKQP